MAGPRTAVRDASAILRRVDVLSPYHESELQITDFTCVKSAAEKIGKPNQERRTKNIDPRPCHPIRDAWFKMHDPLPTRMAFAAQASRLHFERQLRAGGVRSERAGAVRLLGAIRRFVSIGVICGRFGRAGDEASEKESDTSCLALREGGGSSFFDRLGVGGGSSIEHPASSIRVGGGRSFDSAVPASLRTLFAQRPPSG